jgi:RND superfamily putative drug exporter
MTELFDKVAQQDNVDLVESPYDPANTSRLVSSNGDSAGKVAFANVNVPEDLQTPDATKIRDYINDNAPKIDGLQIELGGEWFAEFENPSSETIGLAFAIIILIFAFGSVLAMGLPVASALFGIFIGTSMVALLSHAFTIPETSFFVGLMIGLGVGIDYALLIVTRYREQLHAGHSVKESVVIAIDTAGRSVLFAGITVVISLLGMLVMGVTFVTGLALGAAFVVTVTIAASLTLLPALLGFAGNNVEKTRWRGLIAAGLVAVGLFGVGLGVGALAVFFPLAILVLIAGFFVPRLKREVKRKPEKALRDTLAYRWSRVIQHRPWPAALLAAVVLLVLAVPLLSMRLGHADESNFPSDSSTKRAYNLLVEGFGVGYNGPLLLVADLPEGFDRAQLTQLTAAVNPDAQGGSDGVAFMSPPIVSENGRAAFWNVVPTTGPQDAKTTSLVNHVRDDVLPPIEESLGATVHVSGPTAVNIDFTDYLAARLPWFFVAVLGLSFLLLMAVFRSLLVPLKAVIMNLLTIGASYGVVVALFQWGWLSDLTNVSPAPIETWMPMMLFAITFGLSMDYEVFLLSRVQEEWHRSGDTRTSVADGLAATAKVITAAAAIMVVVFGSFVLEDVVQLKMMGIGLAVAIFLDATIVRMILVPSTMELLGDRNWWMPRWLDRVVPRLNVEGQIPHSVGEDGGWDPDELTSPVLN